MSEISVNKISNISVATTKNISEIKTTNSPELSPSLSLEKPKTLNVDKAEMSEKTLEKLESQLKESNLKVNYYKNDSGQKIMEIKDIDTNQVIRQIPSKEQVAIAESIDEFLHSYNKEGLTQSQKPIILQEQVKS